MRHMKQRGFALIELLVVIATLVLLLSILLPSLKKGKDAASMNSCASNAQQIMLVFTLYINETNEGVPRSTTRIEV